MLYCVLIEYGVGISSGWDEGIVHSLSDEIRNKLASIPGVELSDRANAQTQLIDFLTQTVARLVSERNMLRYRLHYQANMAWTEADPGEEDVKDTDQTDNPDIPIFKEFHYVHCTNKRTYTTDVPKRWKGDTPGDHLRGQAIAAESMTRYLEEHRNVVFSVIHQYACHCRGGDTVQRVAKDRNGRLVIDSPSAKKDNTQIIFNSPLKYAIRSLVDQNQDRCPGYIEGCFPSMFFEPYLPFYLHGKVLKQLADSANLSEFDAQSVKLVCKWVEDDRKDDWAEADELFSRGKVTAKHCNKLFQPGELAVSPEKQQKGTNASHCQDGLLVAYKVEEYAWNDDYDHVIDTYTWNFNGAFRKEELKVDLSNLITQSYLINGTRGEEGENQKEDPEISITSLWIYPVRFAKAGIYEKLVARGNKLWSCRKKKHVAYFAPESEGGDSKMVSCCLINGSNCSNIMKLTLDSWNSATWSTIPCSGKGIRVIRYSQNSSTILVRRHSTRMSHPTMSSWR